MRGRASFKRNTVEPDTKYTNIEVTRFINKLMHDGEKSVATDVMYKAMEIAAERKQAEPLDLFLQVIKTVSPAIEVRSKRVGGATYQVPVEIKPSRKSTLAMRWIIEAARNRAGKPMAESLATQFIEAIEGTGAAVRKRDDVHRMAEANKAFAHYARL